MALVALCGIQRGSKIVHFDTKNMFGNETGNTFGMEGESKTLVKARQTHKREFLPYKNFCPVATLIAYVKRTKN